jgi:hypothetical protein
MPGGYLGNFAEINFAPKNSRDRRHAFISYPARDNHLKEFQIGVYIERESMTRYPSRNSHSNRRDLFIANPDASEALDATALDSVIRNRANQYFFEVAHVAMNIAAIGFEIDYWITDELTGAVVSDIAAAPGLVDLY